MGTQELQVIEFEITELVPAKVVSNIDDLKNFMEIVKQKYKGWIVTEDDIDIAKSERTKLNKLEKIISSERKKVQKKANAGTGPPRRNPIRLGRGRLPAA